MSKVVLKVENLSKQYRLGTVGSSTLRDDISRFWARLRGKEDPTLKIGEVNDRTTKGNSDYVWALKDINFEVKQGEILGIIGKNGAGKSTLLKILSKVTGPTTGRVRAKGRIASLLEVGTGFHPELTGRENIYLNGAILGMTKAEIRAKLDEIVDFAGVEKYLDTPVKRYSSGMKVRLGFAVAAHLEPEILIVDEVLAVGDAEFQKKAIGKMQDVSNGEGRTVLFVSHNMQSIKHLCNSAIVLLNGSKFYQGPTETAIGKYLQRGSRINNCCIWKRPPSYKESNIKLISVSIENRKGIPSAEFDMFDEIYFNINYEIVKDIPNGLVNFCIHDDMYDYLLSFDTDTSPEMMGKREKGFYKSRVCLPIGLLKEGDYKVTFKTGVVNQQIFEELKGTCSFSIRLNSEFDSYLSYAKKRNGLVASKIEWNTKKIQLDVV